jgi:cytochrome bd-type quinol oxidase subunit 1
MENGNLMNAFTEWEVIVVCVLFMFLLPLIFFLASTRRRPQRKQLMKKKHVARARVAVAANDLADGKDNEAQGPNE